MSKSVSYLQCFNKCLGLKNPILVNLQMSTGTPLALSLTDKDSELSSQILQINCKNLSDSNSLCQCLFTENNSFSPQTRQTFLTNNCDIKWEIVEYREVMTGLKIID